MEREVLKMGSNVVTMKVFSTLLYPVLPVWDTPEIREERQSRCLFNGVTNEARQTTRAPPQ